tara:strand:+ start:156 stop:398 length:243 start_codon:yes stop_codon:yes gene_type:complete
MRTEYLLPTELASGLINDDWSFLDYIDDIEYNKIIDQLLSDLDDEGLFCYEVKDDNRFEKYHDLVNYGLKACDCSTFIFN